MIKRIEKEYGCSREDAIWTMEWQELRHANEILGVVGGLSLAYLTWDVTKRAANQYAYFRNPFAKLAIPTFFFFFGHYCTK